MSAEAGSEGDKRIRVQISEQDFLCKNGCGYYGTPQSKGLCSQCWRVSEMQEKRKQDYAKNRSLLSFEKFEARKQTTDRRASATFRSLLRKDSSNQQGSPSPVARQQQHRQDQTPRSRQLSGESQQAREKFLSFLHGMPKSLAHDISRQTQHAIDNILAHQHIEIDELSELVQNFYQVMTDRLNKHPLMNDINAKVSPEEVMQEVEQYVCVRTYPVLFCAKTDEEVADLSLQDRIRSLHWVTAGFLETNLDYSNEKVRDRMDDAITEIIDINSRRGTADKLECLIRCSKSIFEALKDSRSGAPASADEFLPVLIFVILKGNPPLIQSNLKFISRFALPTRVMSGESGYYFTNLSCALQFVQNMNADSLRMPKEEFEAYTSGNQVPPLTESNCGCNQAIKSMENSAKQLAELIEKQKTMAVNIDEFRERIMKETDEFMTEVRSFTRNYPSVDLSIPKSQPSSPEANRDFSVTVPTVTKAAVKAEENDV
uniref:Rab5 GDP/GTP exchange factor n=1 Tax=Plectus sambesii TaxID=2011161 RepID=A0A914UN01_9BILA